MTLQPDIMKYHTRLQTDLEFFCRRYMKIKHKEGGEVPFEWNKAQRYLHSEIEKQLQETGMVRMFIIKGRQQGISTYIAARLYHKITRQRSKNVFILSHHSTTTETLFQIVERYHANCPSAATPKCTVNNNRRMKFENGSQYTVGTAGSGAIGRGDTNQFIHASEAAFYENTDEINTGVMQTVADAPGTEKLIESTANGVGNYFHQGCMDALEGKGQYRIVFIPWFWQDEYRASIPDSFSLEEEEVDLKEMYGLDDRQIQWRRNKIHELKSLKKFRQEYPFTVREAFQASGSPLIDPDIVARARKSKITDAMAPLIIGVDPAPVHDRTVISWRRGRHMIKKESIVGLAPMALAGKLATIINRDNPAKVFIDFGEGRGVVDRLHELGYSRVVVGISFAMGASDKEQYLNKRAEMAGEFKDWLEDDGGVRLPDEEDVEVEIGAIPEFKHTSSGLRQLVSKDDIKKVYGKSTDIFDSFILTFAQPVARGYDNANKIRKSWSSTRSELSATNSRRRPEAKHDDFDDSPDGFRKAGRRGR